MARVIPVSDFCSAERLGHKHNIKLECSTKWHKAIEESVPATKQYFSRAIKTRPMRKAYWITPLRYSVTV